LGFLKRPNTSRPAGADDNFSVMLDRLRKAGADPAVPHVTRHFMYVPGVKAAQQVAREVKAPGRNVEIDTSARQGFWLVVVSQSMLLSADQMAALRTEFETAAQAVGGEYDRWQVDIAGA
jgi:hypothetical protein